MTAAAVAVLAADEEVDEVDSETEVAAAVAVEASLLAVGVLPVAVVPLAAAVAVVQAQRADKKLSL